MVVADKAWISQTLQRRVDAHEASSKARDRARKLQEEREALIGAFWDAFVTECEAIIKDVNAFAVQHGVVVTFPSAKLTKGADRALGVSFETHRLHVSLPRDSMLLHLDGIDRAKLTGAGAALEVRGGRLLGARGETPQELANEVMRAFFERAL